MRRVVIHKAGGYDRLAIETGPDPVPAAGEVLIVTEAIGINYADCVVRMGLYASAKKYVGWPITPGFEVAGTIAAVGAGASWKVGDRVLAITRFGGYTTHLVVPAHQVWAIPAGFTVADAAGFPSVFMTAYYALFELARLRPGQRVLVHSAAGGVGGALLQILKIAGCVTVGVVGGPHKVQVARGLGADVVIDKSTENLWRAARRAAPDGFDLILDANGVSTLGESFKHLAAPGRLIVYGFHSMLPRKGGRPDYLKLAADFLRTPRFSPLKMTNENKSVMAFNVSYLFDQRELLVEGMAKLLGWVADGSITAPPTKSYPFDKVADAHRAIESGTTVGKLILVP